MTDKKKTGLNGRTAQARDKTSDKAGTGLPLLDLETWMPYRLWLFTTNFADCVEAYYAVRHKLSRNGWHALAQLACHAPLSAKELAERANMNQVDTTRAIGQLLRLKLIKRGTDTVDRRRAVLNLTNRGMATYAEIADISITIEKNLYGVLTRTEYEQLSHILEKLRTKETEILEQRREWERGGSLVKAGVEAD